MRYIKGAAVVVLCLFTASITAQQKPNIKIVPASRVDATSGAALYSHHCASCHGNSGRGDGPVAVSLKTPPADLTSLTKHNAGKFPELKVYNAIRGDANVAAHGNKEMPVWGDLFWKLDDDANHVSLRIRNLTRFVESLQSK